MEQKNITVFELYYLIVEFFLHLDARKCVISIFECLIFMVAGHVVTTGHYFTKISMVCNTMSLYITGHSITAGHIFTKQSYRIMTALIIR